jgi:hypothetical protein
MLSVAKQWVSIVMNDQDLSIAKTLARQAQSAKRPLQDLEAGVANPAFFETRQDSFRPGAPLEM